MSSRKLVTFPIVLRELTVLRVTDITPGMRRVTLGGEQLKAFRSNGFDMPPFVTEGFDDHVKFFFTAEGEEHPVLPRQNISSLDWPEDARPLAKDYTPRRFDPVAGEVDFDFVRHGHGVASTWAQQAVPGQKAWIAGPKMAEGHPEADWILAIGDETALPAIGRWLEEMPEGTRAKVLIEVAAKSHRQHLPTRADVEITWLYRNGAPAGTTTLLEDALRDLEWLPGKVFVWAGGEAVTLKPIRRHLKTERELSRDQMHITGYWRRTETADAHDEDDAHDRLHELTDLAPPLAIRAAVTLGLIDLIHKGVTTPADLARKTSCEPSTLEALLAYLAEIEILTPTTEGYTLSPVGEEIAEDDHSADEYDLNGATAALDLSLTALVPTLTNQGNYRTPTGEPLTEAFLTDPQLAETSRTAIEDQALWVAPSVLTSYDWSTVETLTSTGHGAASITNALLTAHPALKARITAAPSTLRLIRETILSPEILPRLDLLPQTDQAPPEGDTTYLLANALPWLPDEDAIHLLATTAARLPADGNLLVIEQTRTPDPEDTLHHLRLKCAFGSGLRTPSEVTELLTKAGLKVLTTQEIGWDNHLWTLTR
ncbi:siderophore-interacting protein [Actinomadura hibisca]|uniref:siderophore-interacting protein n=1 Tax=Actinomadura hibisca TaxID=68565 RepID=UPI00083398F6|nr:siderophore-interacting protein [Actinomadura hibisca]